MILTRGGSVSYSLDANVTHFVATAIPVYIQRKAKIKLPYHLVHPLWVFQCAASNKLLSVDLFALGASSLVHTLKMFEKRLVMPEKAVESNGAEKNSAADVQPALVSEGSTVLAASPMKLANSPPKRMLTSEENPNFIADYLSQSRLHHLSSWKTQLIARLKDNIGQQPVPAGIEILSRN